MPGSRQPLQLAELRAREHPKPDHTLSYGEDPLQIVDVWRPAGSETVPCVLMIHGGCWQTAIAERDLMNWIADDLRRHGAGVWNIEYRGVDRNGGYPGTFEDIGRGADLFREKAAEFGFADTSIPVVGHSAGGHLALWLANRTALPATDRLRGADPLAIDLAVSLGGLPNLVAGASRQGHRCGTEAPARMTGPNPASTSPPHMLPGPARQILVNTTLDDIAPPAYAKEYADKVREKGLTPELVVIEDEGHIDLIAPESRSWAAVRRIVLQESGR